MILSDKEIRQAIKRGRIAVTPEPLPEQFTSSALDLRLGEKLFKWIPATELAAVSPPGLERPVLIDPSKISDPHLIFNTCTREVPYEADHSYVLKPKELVLGATMETISLPRGSKLAARVEGRSTLARCGLVVHLTAPVIHAGFKGVIVLEMYNFGEHPIKLVPGARYCQLVFEKLSQIPGAEPATKYQSQRGVQKK